MSKWGTAMISGLLSGLLTAGISFLVVRQELAHQDETRQQTTQAEAYGEYLRAVLDWQVQTQRLAAALQANEAAAIAKTAAAFDASIDRYIASFPSLSLFASEAAWNLTDEITVALANINTATVQTGPADQARTQLLRSIRQACQPTTDFIQQARREVNPNLSLPAGRCPSD